MVVFVMSIQIARLSPIRPRLAYGAIVAALVSVGRELDMGVEQTERFREPILRQKSNGLQDKTITPVAPQT